jgi:hypothetical protein
LEPLNGGLGSGAVGHLDEAKPTGLAGVPVGNDIDRVHITIRLEELAQVMISGAEGKIADKDIHACILIGESVETIARSSEQYAEAKKRKSTMQEKRRETLAAKSCSLGIHRIEAKL